MKTKLLMIFAILIAFSLDVSAIEMNDSNTTPVPLKTNGPGNHDHGGFNRGEEIVTIYQEDHVLNFGTDYSDCAISLLDENELIEYSGIVGSDGIVAVPDYLEGLFELRLTVDNIVYTGEILLE